MCVSTGNRYLDIGIGVALGAATGGLTTAATLSAGGITGAVAGTSVGLGTALGATTIGTAGALGGAILGGVGSAVTSSLFAPPEFPTYQAPQQTAQVQQFNSQQIATTGSGGRQATASLAEAIQRSRQRKLSQEDVSDLSIDTSAFASTGLQLA
jgi:hypothetical protein